MIAPTVLEHSIRRALGGFGMQRSGTRILSLDATQFEPRTLSLLTQCLAPGELQRAQAMREPARSTYVVSHACLRIAISCALRVPLAQVAYQPAAGKPRLVPALTRQRDLDFSLSHTGHEVLIGLRLGGWIGVDIERIDLAHPLLRHAAKVCSAEELRLRPPPSTDPQAAGWLFGHWVGKEAYLKATGAGLPALPLRALTLRHNPERNCWTVEVAPKVQQAAVYALPVRSGFCAAACLIPRTHLGPR